MRLCCLHDGCNGAVGLSLSHVVLQGAAEDGQLPVGLEEDLVQPLQDAARDARFLMLQAPGQILEQPFGLVRVLLVPGLAQRFLDAGVQMLGQALDDVTALMNLAALEGGGYAEAVSDRRAERLNTIDDEPLKQLRISEILGAGVSGLHPAPKQAFAHVLQPSAKIRIRRFEDVLHHQ